jgi:hypothetical protein
VANENGEYQSGGYSFYITDKNKGLIKVKGIY